MNGPPPAVENVSRSSSQDMKTAVANSPTSWSESVREKVDRDSCEGRDQPGECACTSTTSCPERLKTRLACALFLYFLCGWSDGVTGTVLPYIHSEYGLNFTTSSLLFVASTCGFFLGTLLVERVRAWFGLFYLESTSRFCFPAWSLPFRRRYRLKGYSPSQARFFTLCFFSLVHPAFFVMMGSRSGFTATFLAYVVASFARSFWTATLNVYIATAAKQKLGFVFGAWSFGSATSPIVCQTIMAAGVHWSRFFWGSLVVSSFNFAFVVYSFRPTAREVAEDKQACQEALRVETPSVSSHEKKELGDNKSSVQEASNVPAQTLKRTLSLPYQWLFTIFACLYSGCETTTQGYMVTYLLEERSANPKTVGYVVSGFWLGETLGRTIWGYVTPRTTYTQRKYAVYAFLLISLAMHFLLWFINSTVGNAFSAAIIGLVYGPMWPGVLAMANDVMPAEVRMVSMAVISAFGCLGASLFPFIGGVVFNVGGVRCMPYLTVAETCIMFLLWTTVPSKIRASSGELSPA